MVGRTIAFCRLSTCLVLSEVDRVEKPPSYVGPIDVGQVANLRGGWLPPPVRCECGSGPIDNRPQLAKLPHKVSLAGQPASQFFKKFRAPEGPSQQTTKGDGLSHLNHRTSSVNQSGRLSTSRGLLPSGGPMMPSRCIISRIRAARPYPRRRWRCNVEVDALPICSTRRTASSYCGS